MERKKGDGGGGGDDCLGMMEKGHTTNSSVDILTFAIYFRKRGDSTALFFRCFLVQYKCLYKRMCRNGVKYGHRN